MIISYSELGHRGLTFVNGNSDAIFDLNRLGQVQFEGSVGDGGSLAFQQSNNR